MTSADPEGDKTTQFDWNGIPIALDLETAYEIALSHRFGDGIVGLLLSDGRIKLYYVQEGVFGGILDQEIGILDPLTGLVQRGKHVAAVADIEREVNKAGINPFDSTFLVGSGMATTGDWDKFFRDEGTSLDPNSLQAMIQSELDPEFTNKLRLAAGLSSDLVQDALLYYAEAPLAASSLVALKNARLGTLGNAPNSTIKNFDIVDYRPSNPPFQNHHGVLDVWAKHNIEGYVTRGTKTPTVALTKTQHEATKRVYRDWL